MKKIIALLFLAFALFSTSIFADAAATLTAQATLTEIAQSQTATPTLTSTPSYTPTATQTYISLTVTPVSGSIGSWVSVTNLSPAVNIFSASTIFRLVPMDDGNTATTRTITISNILNATIFSRTFSVGQKIPEGLFNSKFSDIYYFNADGNFWSYAPITFYNTGLPVPLFAVVKTDFKVAILKN
jgi:hypothetical protein